MRDGDYAQITPGSENLQRRDMVAHKFPKDPTQIFIKRIIGLPGERVEIKNGSVFVNGAKLDESKYSPSMVTTYGSAGIVTLTSNQYSVLGDNRTASSDSRVWGPVSSHLIIGKVISANRGPTKN